MRIQDPALLANYRLRTRCSWCGRSQPGRICAHHIFTRGAGGSDLVENLLGLDFECHLHVQEHVPRQAQLEVLAYELRTTTEKLVDFNFAVRRLDKSATQADVQRLRQEIFKGAA